LADTNNRTEIDWLTLAQEALDLAAQMRDLSNKRQMKIIADQYMVLARHAREQAKLIRALDFPEPKDAAS
jgi:hypothetical protein